jgi:hypothetical protein
LKNSPYFNPVLVVGDESMSLKGGTLDNAPFLNDLFDNNAAIYICDDTKNIGILDLAPQGIRQLPIHIGVSTPLDLAIKIAFKFVQPWQFEVLKTNVIISVDSSEKLFFTVNQRERYLLSVDEYVTNILKKPQFYFYEYIQCISARYTLTLGVELSCIERIINNICNRFTDQNIVLYGCGEFLKFIYSTFDFLGVSIRISDRDDKVLDVLSDVFPTVKLNEIESTDVIIPMSLEFEFEMKDFLQTELKVNSPIYIAHWHKLRENND